MPLGRDDGDREDAGPERRRFSKHPGWSRVLYLAYAAVPLTAAGFALKEAAWEAAIVSAGIAAVLIWKGAQRAR